MWIYALLWGRAQPRAAQVVGHIGHMQVLWLREASLLQQAKGLHNTLEQSQSKVL